MSNRAVFEVNCQVMDRYEVVKRLERKDISQKEAEILLEVSVRQVKRILASYRKDGISGLMRKPSGGNRAFTADFRKRVISIVKEKYADFGPTLASEKLSEIDGIHISHETLRKLMIEEGLWKSKKGSKARIHQSRQRRPRKGELIQIDGSPHDWFEGRAPKCCALVFVDDATSSLMTLRFEPSETTQGYFRATHSYIQQHGLPIAFYSDKDSVFVVAPRDRIDGLKGETQFQRAMRQLNIKMISAHSPQAKGRVERANQTLQDRLIKEMRLRNICSIEEANAFAPEFIKIYNEKFAKKPAKPEDSHRFNYYNEKHLHQILSVQETRILSKNLEFSYHNTIYQIQRIGLGYALRKQKVIVCEKIDGSIDVIRGQETMKYKVLGQADHQPVLCDGKGVNSIIDQCLAA